ncbi:hypothetical protein BGX34_001018 [Mortierella sp. NVP85]|nr:hypothetical protein BGX34_001018 [Mortierella sp. NVP85]
MLSLPRSASTSQIDSTSPTPHFETTNTGPYPLSTGTRPQHHQRTPLETTLTTAGLSRQSPASRPGTTTLEPIAGGLKVPLNPVSDGLPASGLRGQQCGLSLDPPAMPWWYTKKRTDRPDFVLISEFSEMEGPKAVMTIPDNIVDLTRDPFSMRKQRAQESSGRHPQDSSDTSISTLTPESVHSPNVEDPFDVHEFVLRITSVDQQARETTTSESPILHPDRSGTFHIPEDIEVYLCDAEKGYWAYVHHFTLFDINARGFVRPFCMSYITRDPQKTMTHYEEMRHKFSRAALYFKTGNYTLFRHDLTKKLRDLNYTNNLLSEAPVHPSHSTSDISALGMSPETQTIQDATIHSTLGHSYPSSKEGSVTQSYESQSEQQKADLESIRDAIESATYIISVLEHYSVDGQPLLGHPDEGNDVSHTAAPLCDLSPKTSSENLAMLASGRSGSTDPSLFLGTQASRPGSRIRHKRSTQNILGTAPSRILDMASGSGAGTGGGVTAVAVAEGTTAPLPHLLGLQQQEQSRKNSVVSEYDSMMYEAPEYEPQYATTLYPLFRDEVVFRQLRELCIANVVWNSSIHFHLGIKKIKDILREFQVQHAQVFMMNFRNPDFNRITTRSTQQRESPVPMMDLLQGISLANAPSDDGLSTQEILPPGTQESTAISMPTMTATVDERRSGPNVEGEDADDEQTGYDSLDDAASFFTAATGLATQTETPTKDSFSIVPLDRSARVVEWHQEQQILHHHAKGAAPSLHSSRQNDKANAIDQTPWSFSAGVSQGESSFTGSSFNKTLQRQSAQSGVSVGAITATGSTPTTQYPTNVLETLQKDPALAKDVVFALLSGQKVCVMGQCENESKIRAFISVLATFLPHTGFPSREEQLIEHQRQVVTWYSGPGLLQVERMDDFCLVGVDSCKMDPKILQSNICVLDHDTLTWINGRQYTDGIFLESIFRNMSMFSEDASFLAFVDSKLFEVLLKSFLYYHLIFHGRLYQGGLSGHPYAQALYSSGVSDDGEAFSHQRNFRSSRPSPVPPRSTGASRTNRRNTSSYPSSTQLGITVPYNGTNTRHRSLSSPESSDADEPPEQRRQGKYSRLDGIFGQQQHERDGGPGQVMSADDESSQSGGPMSYSTAQGMRKWKKWLEYWSARSAAMIDPGRARTALGKLDPSGAAVEIPSSGGNSRRKRNSSRRSSPHRRTKVSSGHHANSSRHREAKEREKERDVERDRERSRKSMVDRFDTNKENLSLSLSSSSDSETRDAIGNDDMAAFERGLILDEKSSKDHTGGRNDDLQGANNKPGSDDTLTNMAESAGPNSKASGGTRRLKPKLPLSLHSASKRSDGEHGRSGQEDESASGNGEGLKRTPSSGSASSPPHSATFRSLAGALRATFNHPPPEVTSNAAVSAGRPDIPIRSVRRRSSDGHRNPWSGREMSDSNHSKEVKRRSSARAKAKAWIESKRKSQSRPFDKEHAEQEDLNVGEESRQGDSNATATSGDETNRGSDKKIRPSQPVPAYENLEFTVQAVPRSALPYSTADATTSSAPSNIGSDMTSTCTAEPQLFLDTHQTIQETAAALETSRMTSLVQTHTLPSSTLNSVNVAPSITSSTALSSSTQTGSHFATPIAAASNATITVAADIEGSENGRQHDPAQESTTEYETSMETFAGMDSGNISSWGHASGSRILREINGSKSQSINSPTRSLDMRTSRLTESTVSAGPNNPIPETNGVPAQQVQERQPSLDHHGMEQKQPGEDMSTVSLTEEEEAVVREMLGGVTGSDDWAIIVHLATMVDKYERSKEPSVPVSNEP